MRHKTPEHRRRGRAFHPESILTERGHDLLNNFLQGACVMSQPPAERPSSASSSIAEIFHDEMVSLMRQIMGGEVSPVMIAAILTGLRVKRNHRRDRRCRQRHARTVDPVTIPYDHFVDIVGTGGDSAHTFNISTTSIFVAAAAGAKVAKHGGRSVKSSSSGSADVLGRWVLTSTCRRKQVAECIRGHIGIGFMFAPTTIRR